MSSLSSKLKTLEQFIKTKGKEGVVVALSGGVDSSTLTFICRKILGDNVIAVTTQSPTYPLEELQSALRIAKKIGIKHYLVKTDELSNANFVRNPENRCYYCKKELINCLKRFAKKRKFKVIFEGTNFSDLNEHRPGYSAIKESTDVFSPWAETGFTKEEIRNIASESGLSIYNKPPLACLASRIPFGEPITKEKLKRIESAEYFIKRLCKVKQVRVRDHNGLARIEIDMDERSLVFDEQIMGKIAEKLKKLGFKYITLDLEGYRTGSMLIIAKNQ